MERKETLNISELVDLALASPKSGVVNLSILRCLLHVLVRNSRLNECNIEFRDQLHGIVEKARKQRPSHVTFHMSKFIDGKLRRFVDAEFPGTLKIKTTEECLTENWSVADSILNHVFNQINSDAIATDISRSTVAEIVESTLDQTSAKDELESSIRLIVEEIAKENRSMAEEKGKYRMSLHIIEDLISLALDRSDPCIRLSQIEEKVSDILMRKMHSECVDNLRLEIGKTQNFVEREIEQMKKSIANERKKSDSTRRAEETSGKSKTADSAITLVNDDQNSPMKRRTSIESRKFHSKIESLCQDFTLIEDSSEKKASKKPNEESDFIERTEICSEESSCSDNIRSNIKMVQNRNIETQYSFDSLDKACISDVKTESHPKLLSKPKRQATEVKATRNCGGAHTVSLKSNQKSKKSITNDQYIDFLAIEMKENLRKGKKPIYCALEDCKCAQSKAKCFRIHGRTVDK